MEVKRNNRTTSIDDDSFEAALLDVQQIGKILNCSARHVMRLVDAGRMPVPVKLGTLVRWNRSEIENWISSGCPDLPDHNKRRNDRDD
jgi:excisionase family DNA binding protein